MGFFDNNSNNLRLPTGFSSNINYANGFPVTNNDIPTAPCVNLRATSSNFATISNNVASTSQYHQQYNNQVNMDQNPPPPPPPQSVGNFPPLSFNITIHSPLTNLFELF